MKKILYIRASFFKQDTAGGSVAHTAGVVNALYKVYDLKVLSNRRLPMIKLDQHIIKESILKIIAPLSLREWLFNSTLMKSLQSENPELIYTRHSPLSYAAVKYGKKNKIPVILEYNSSELWKLKNWSSKNEFWLKRILRFAWLRLFVLSKMKFTENHNLQNANLITVVSNQLKLQLIEKGIEKSKILVNPNRVDPTIYNPNVNIDHLKEKFGVNDKTVIGFIGTFGQWHGVDVLSKAINIYFESDSARQDIVFMIIGDGELFNQFKDEIKPYVESKQVILTGLVQQEEGAEYLATCHILLSPHIQNPDGSEFFGSPTKLFEYMAMKKAIIASNIGQISEILSDNENAILVDPNEPDAIVEAISSLVDQPEKIKNLGEKAYQLAMEKYTWDHCQIELTEKLKKLGLL